MADESEILSRFLDVDQLIKSDMQENSCTRTTDNSTSQWYGPATATPWHSNAHLANNFAPIQIVPYQQAPNPVFVNYRLCQPEVAASPGVPYSRFLYVLNASTSPATKITDESITFLNQGQSYEIQLICSDNLLSYSSLKSVVRVSFNDRRLQFMEKEQLQLWKQERHPTEKLIELDVPLCYGVTCSKDDSTSLNSVEFLWDTSAQKAAVSIKLNCVSTEFTVKKCGGERGIPLRIQVDTYGSAESHLQQQQQQQQQQRQQQGDDKLLHSAYCLVKVFKPKGAERKLKNDLEWLNRLLPDNKKCYRPAQEKTFLAELSPEEFSRYQSSSTSLKHQPPSFKNCLQNPLISTTDIRATGLSLEPSELEEYKRTKGLSPKASNFQTSGSSGTMSTEGLKLDSQMTPQEVVQWMKLNQFDDFVNVLSKYTGADLLRLSRKDFIEICGVAEGIRFSNAVRNRPYRPKLTIYVCIETFDVGPGICCREAKLERQGSLDSFVLSPANSLASSPSTTGNSFAQSFTFNSQNPSLATSFQSSLDNDKVNNSFYSETPRKRTRDFVEEVFDNEFPALKKFCSRLDIAAKSVYRLVNLDFLTRSHLVERLSTLCGIQSNQVLDVYIQNSKDLLIEITDLVVENMEDESHLKLEVIPVEGFDAVQPGFVLLLKTSSTLKKAKEFG